MIHTTFRLLREANACEPSYVRFAKAVGGVRAYGDTTPIPLDKVLEINGLADTLWCLRAVLPEECVIRDRLARLFACDCAEHVLPLFESQHPNDNRPRAAIEAAFIQTSGQPTINNIIVEPTTQPSVPTIEPTPASQSRPDSNEL